MLDAKNGIIPELGNNNPLYRNINGDTVAMLYAENGIIPPREWMYDVDYKYFNCKTLR